MLFVEVKAVETVLDLKGSNLTHELLESARFVSISTWKNSRRRVATICLERIGFVRMVGRAGRIEQEGKEEQKAFGTLSPLVPPVPSFSRNRSPVGSGANGYSGLVKRISPGAGFDPCDRGSSRSSRRQTPCQSVVRPDTRGPVWTSSIAWSSTQVGGKRFVRANEPRCTAQLAARRAANPNQRVAIEHGDGAAQTVSVVEEKNRRALSAGIFFDRAITSG